MITDHIRNLSKGTAMEKLTKLVNKNFRDYSNYIRISNKLATYSDGDFLIEQRKVSNTPGLYNAQLEKVEVKIDYPKVASFKPKTKPVQIKSQNLLDSIKYVTSPGEHRIGVNQNGEVYLTEDSDPKKEGYLFFSFDNLQRAMRGFSSDELKKAEVFLYPSAKYMNLTIQFGDYKVYFPIWKKPIYMALF